MANLWVRKSISALQAEAASEGEHSLKRTLTGMNLMSLGILEAINGDPDDHQKLVSVKTAREELWRELAEGGIGATGLNASNSTVQIPAHEWPYLELAGDLRVRDYVIQRSMSLKAAFRDLRFSRISVQGIWPDVSEVAESGPN
ncbi:MAG: hypothetical protein ABI882_17330, partial [Acidobacteriota bacterium]